MPCGNVSLISSPLCCFSLTLAHSTASVGSLGIPEEKLPLLNKTGTEHDWHRLPPELGGGIQAFFEGFHHIHCLVSIHSTS